MNLPDSKQLMTFGLKLVVVVGGVLLANNVFQPMINKMKVSAPAKV